MCAEFKEFLYPDEKNHLMESDVAVVLKDKYPKAYYHFLVVSKEVIANISMLKKENLPLLAAMHVLAKQVIEQHAKFPIEDFLIGFKIRPFFNRLVMHVISKDFCSTSMRRHHHWNIFHTELFLSYRTVCDLLETQGHIVPMDEEKFQSLRAQKPLNCNQCDFSSDTFVGLKFHLGEHWQQIYQERIERAEVKEMIEKFRCTIVEESIVATEPQNRLPLEENQGKQLTKNMPTNENWRYGIQQQSNMEQSLNAQYQRFNTNNSQHQQKQYQPFNRNNSQQYQPINPNNSQQQPFNRNNLQHKPTHQLFNRNNSQQYQHINTNNPQHQPTQHQPFNRNNSHQPISNDNAQYNSTQQNRFQRQPNNFNNQHFNRNNNISHQPFNKNNAEYNPTQQNNRFQRQPNNFNKHNFTQMPTENTQATNANPFRNPPQAQQPIRQFEQQKAASGHQNSQPMQAQDKDYNPQPNKTNQPKKPFIPKHKQQKQPQARPTSQYEPRNQTLGQPDNQQPNNQSTPQPLQEQQNSDNKTPQKNEYKPKQFIPKHKRQQKQE